MHRGGQQEGEAGPRPRGIGRGQAGDHGDTPDRLMPGTSAADLGTADEPILSRPTPANRWSLATAASRSSTVEGGSRGPAAVAPTATGRPTGAGNGAAARRAAAARRSARGTCRRVPAAEHGPERVLQKQTADPDRDRGQDEQPGQALVRGPHPTVPDRGEQAADDPHPVAPEEDQQCEGGRDVQPDDERQVRRFRRGQSRSAPSSRPTSAGSSTLCPRLDTGEQLGESPWTTPSAASPG